jgi:hypothetical protein
VFSNGALDSRLHFFRQNVPDLDLLS